MRVYAELESALFEGRLRPGQRLKIRDLAAAMTVSETPVREAIMQLVRTGALRMETARAITVAGLTLAQFLELRTIRFELEGLAAEEAARCVTDAEIEALASAHERMIAAEAAGDTVAANKASWEFHGGLYRAARMPQLMEIISNIWHRNGPMQALLYPDALPTYPGRHRHLDILDALRGRDGTAARAALRADLIEGGANLVRALAEREATAAAPARTRKPRTRDSA